MTYRPPVLNGFTVDELLDLHDDNAFAPRTAVHAQLLDTFESRQLPPVTNQQVYAFLRAYGFREVTRRGVRGFLGITTRPPFHGAQRRVPTGTASSYRHRGDRSLAAKQAYALDRFLRDWSKEEPPPRRRRRSRYLEHHDWYRGP